MGTASPWDRRASSLSSLSSRAARVPAHRGVHLAKGLKGQLPGQQGRQAHAVIQEEPVRRARPLSQRQQLRPVGGGEGPRVLFPRLGGGVLIKHPRSRGRAWVRSPSTRRRQSTIRVLPVQQQQVGPAAHGFQHQTAADFVPHLIGGLDNQLRQTLHRRLMERQDFSPRQIFPQQHAEHGGLGGVLPGQIGELEPGPAGVGRQQQAAAPRPAPDLQQNFVPAGLVDLVDPSAQHRRLHLPADGGQAKGVHGHVSPLLPSSSQTAH